MKKVFATLGVVIGLGVVVGLVVIYSGWVDVAATSSDPPGLDWVLSTTMDHSVAHHAANIKVPKLGSQAQLYMGTNHYQEMCVGCHGAPGVKPGEIAKGLNPPAPDLTKSLGDWTPAEMFWVTKHGVKMTGMPGWGPTHSDAKIWAIVSLLEKLPKMSPKEYGELVAHAKAHGDDDDD